MASQTRFQRARILASPGHNGFWRAKDRTVAHPPQTKVAIELPSTDTVTALVAWLHAGREQKQSAKEIAPAGQHKHKHAATQHAACYKATAPTGRERTVAIAERELT